MGSIPRKGYFAKPLALRTLFGDFAFQDLKRLMDPCCGIGIDKICTEPCSGPILNYTLSAEFIECVDGVAEYTLSGIALNSIESPVSVTAYSAVSPFTEYTVEGTVTKPEITAGVHNFGQISLEPGEEIRFLLIDSRGNWSNILIIIPDPC